MPMYVYCDESPRLYPYPPIARGLEPGDQVELDEDELPGDGRFQPAELCTDADLARLRALADLHHQAAAESEALHEIEVPATAPPADEPTPTTPPAPAVAKASKTPKE